MPPGSGSCRYPGPATDGRASPGADAAHTPTGPAPRPTNVGLRTSVPARAGGRDDEHGRRARTCPTACSPGGHGLAPCPPIRRLRCVVADDDPTYNDVIDWLSEREAKQVYVEIGLHDPTQAAPTLSSPCSTTLRSASRRSARTWTTRGAGSPTCRSRAERNRFFIDPAHISAIRGGGPGFKIWFHDSTYIGFVG